MVLVMFIFSVISQKSTLDDERIVIDVEAVVTEDRDDEDSSQDAVNGASLPFLGGEEGFEALDEIYVVKQSREHPDTGSED